MYSDSRLMGSQLFSTLMTVRMTPNGKVGESLGAYAEYAPRLDGTAARRISQTNRSEKMKRAMFLLMAALFALSCNVYAADPDVEPTPDMKVAAEPPVTPKAAMPAKKHMPAKHAAKRKSTPKHNASKHNAPKRKVVRKAH